MIRLSASTGNASISPETLGRTCVRIELGRDDFSSLRRLGDEEQGLRTDTDRVDALDTACTGTATCPWVYTLSTLRNLVSTYESKY